MLVCALSGDSKNNSSLTRAVVTAKDVDAIADEGVAPAHSGRRCIPLHDAGQASPGDSGDVEFIEVVEYGWGEERVSSYSYWMAREKGWGTGGRHVLEGQTLGHRKKRRFKTS